MASVYRKRGTWYLRVKDSTGRWQSRASDARTKVEARRLAEDVERRAERIRLGLEAAPAGCTHRDNVPLNEAWCRHSVVRRFIIRRKTRVVPPTLIPVPCFGDPK
jgi:hypothetical protein